MNNFVSSTPLVVGHYRRHPLELDAPHRVREFLGQGKFWVNASLEKMKIKDMDSDYLLATMVHLLKRAPELHMVATTDEYEASCPHWWLRQTTLFMSLKERYEKLTR